jgi:hypothetical protein
MSTDWSGGERTIAAELAAGVDAVPLVDHHVHGALRHETGRRQLEQMLPNRTGRFPTG